MTRSDASDHHPTASEALASLWERLADRQVAVLRSSGTVDHEGWRLVGFDDEGVSVTHDEAGLDKWLSWGQLLQQNPHLIPLDTPIRTASGQLGYFKGLEGDQATFEAFASFRDQGVRSRDFFRQVQVEPLEPFAARNREVFGQPPVGS